MKRTFPALCSCLLFFSSLLLAVEGIEVKIIDFGKIGGGVIHAKYFIVDDEQIFLGSQNFDWRSLKHIHELGVRIKDQEIVNTFQEVFNADWNLAENEESAAVRFGSSKIIVPVSLERQDRTIPVVPVYSPKNFIPDARNIVFKNGGIKNVGTYGWISRTLFPR